MCNHETPGKDLRHSRIQTLVDFRDSEIKDILSNREETKVAIDGIQEGIGKAQFVNCIQ